METLAAPTSPAGPALAAAPGTEPLPQVHRKTIKAMSKHGWRLRRQLSPLAAMVALWFTALIIRMFGAPHWVIYLILAVVAGLAWVAARMKLDRASERVYAATVITAASLWLALTVKTGTLLSPMPAWLAGGGGIISVPYWWHYRLRGVPKDPELEVVEPEGVDERIIEWNLKVATARGPLPDSRLYDIEEIRGGWAATIEILRGNTQRAVMAANDIGAALKLTAGSIFIEPTPQGELHLARILVLTENPLSSRLDWTGPTLDVSTGVSILGWYADMEPVRYRHYRNDSGPVHTLIAGSTDSGKSRTVEQLLAEERHSGVIASHLIDGKGGTSLPDWAESVDEYATTVEEARALLHKDRNRMYLRIEILKTCVWTDHLGRARKGLSQFTPGDPRHGLPMLSITIDEAQKILADEKCREYVEEMIGMARSCGIKFRLITQVPLLSSLGNSSLIRDAVAAGNVIVLRTANRLSGQVAFNGALPVDPCSLPKQWPNGDPTSGLGFVFAPGAERAATMRVGYVEDPFHWAITGTPAQMEPYTGPDAQGGGGAAQIPEQAPLLEENPEAQRIGDDAVLAYLAGHEGQEVPRGEMFNDIQAKVSPPPALRTLTKAITDLIAEELIEKTGRGLYRITEKGIERCRAAA